MTNGMFVLGLDAENVARLKAGKTIVKDLSDFGGRDQVLIMYGDTLADIVKAIERATGQKLPPMQPAPSTGGKPS